MSKWKTIEDGLPVHGQWVIARTERRPFGWNDDESAWHICVFDSDSKSFTRSDLLYVDPVEWHPLPSRKKNKTE